MRLRSALSLVLLGFAGHEADAIAQSAGSFTATGNMVTARFGHTATLLSNGKVLIAGGNIVCYFTAVPCSFPTNAELYDPATGTFIATGGMSTVRPVGGILLPDDRVLFAGSDSTGDPAVVEIYDPSTGSFTVAGNPKIITAVSTATLLNDGRVLLTGTSGSFAAPVAGAELYDPATGTFTPVANWFAEDPMSATLLVDGRVFFVYYEDYAQVYDPVAGTFSQTKVLREFDDPPAATLLFSGSVLFTGGDGLGGKSAGLYDFFANTFTIASMPVARDGHTATLLPDSTVLLAGGGAGAVKDPATNTADTYTPANGSFTATANMITGRASHTGTLLKNGQVLIAGGTPFGSLNSISGISSAELYTPNVLAPAPVLFSVSGDGQGQGAIWDATTATIASPNSPAAAGEILSMYTTSLADGSVIPPQVAVGGRLAQVLYFGAAPGYPGYYQVNFLVPAGVPAGPSATPVRLSYIGRSSNTVTIGVQ